jgi:hypothetical protein
VAGFSNSSRTIAISSGAAVPYVLAVVAWWLKNGFTRTVVSGDIGVTNTNAFPNHSQHFG